MKKILFILLNMQLLFATSALPITSGKAVNDSVKLKEKKYYTIIVPKNKSIRVNLTELEADVDLYIKKGNEVRVRFNDCYSSNSNRENEECIVTNEGETSIYTILVNGFKGSSFTLKATVEGAEEIPTLTSDPIADAVEKKEGKQYKLTAKKDETITVTLSDLTADADLRVKVGRKAGLHSFDCKSTHGGTKTDECVITPKKDATVYVQVYGYRAANYSLKAVKGNTSNLCITKEELKRKIENNEDVTDVNTSCITDMSELFYFKEEFNQDISSWDVSNVTNMRRMFWYATKFNQPIGNWNVSNVTNMSNMFYATRAINQDLSNWNVSNVTNMSGIFNQAISFNQPIGNWDVSNVTNMSGMFSQAKSFNQPIGNWDVSNVTNMHGMFAYAESFNQPISNWDVSNVTNMKSLFHTAISFNQPIGKWNVSNVTEMGKMFYGRDYLDFNQDISNWDVSNVTGMGFMFYQKAAKNSTRNFKFNNHDLSKWNVNKVMSHINFFNNNTNNIEPKWNDYNIKLISKAKYHCLNSDNSTDDVLCVPEYNHVFILKNDGINKVVHIISTENNEWEDYGRYTVSTSGNINTLSLHKLKNTKLFYIKSTTSKKLFLNFYFPYNMQLNSALDEISIPKNDFTGIKTYDNGHKMFIKYVHANGNDSADLYDISDLSNIKRISE